MINCDVIISMLHYGTPIVAIFNSRTYSTFRPSFNVQPLFNVQPYSTFSPSFNVQPLFNVQPYSTFSPSFNIQPLFNVQPHRSMFNHHSLPVILLRDQAFGRFASSVNVFENSCSLGKIFLLGFVLKVDRCYYCMQELALWT